MGSRRLLDARLSVRAAPTVWPVGPAMTGMTAMVTLLGALLFARTAHAEPAGSGPYAAACISVSPAESDRAHTLYQAGKAYYDDANYEPAIAQFREAYKKDCSKHELLIIISRSYELKADRAAAVDALEEYVKRVPTSPDLQQHKTRIENLRKQLAIQAATVSHAVAPSPVLPPANQPADTAMRSHSVPPWIMIGVGGAAVVVGISLLAAAPSLPEGCSASERSCRPATGESPIDFQDRQDRAGRSQTMPTVGALVVGVGGALVLGGLLWHFLEPTGPVQKASRPRLPLDSKLALGPASMSVSGTF